MTKVGEPQRTVGRDEEIGELHIAVGHAVGVAVREGCEQIGREAVRPRLAYTIWMTRDEGLEVPSRIKLEEKKRLCTTRHSE